MSDYRYLCCASTWNSHSGMELVAADRCVLHQHTTARLFLHQRAPCFIFFSQHLKWSWYTDNRVTLQLRKHFVELNSQRQMQRQLWKTKTDVTVNLALYCIKLQLCISQQNYRNQAPFSTKRAIFWGKVSANDCYLSLLN